MSRVFKSSHSQIYILTKSSGQVSLDKYMNIPIQCSKLDVDHTWKSTVDMQNSVSTNSEIKQSKTNFSETKFNDRKKMIIRNQTRKHDSWIKAFNY